MAVRKNHETIVNLLLQYKANLEAQSAVCEPFSTLSISCDLFVLFLIIGWIYSVASSGGEGIRTHDLAITRIGSQYQCSH